MALLTALYSTIVGFIYKEVRNVEVQLNLKLETRRHTTYDFKTIVGLLLEESWIKELGVR